MDDERHETEEGKGSVRHLSSRWGSSRLLSSRQPLSSPWHTWPCSLIASSFKRVRSSKTCKTQGQLRMGGSRTKLHSPLWNDAEISRFSPRSEWGSVHQAALRPYVRLRLVAVQLVSRHFSIDWTRGVAQKRARTVIVRVLQAPHPPPLLGPSVHTGEIKQIDPQCFFLS